MFAKIFLVALVASAAFLGTAQAKSVQTYSNVDDLKETLVEMRHLYDEYLNAEVALFQEFVQNFLRTYEKLASATEENVHQLLEGLKENINKINASGSDIINKIKECIAAEKGPIVEAHNKMVDELVKNFDKLIEEFQRISDVVYATECAKNVQEFLQKCSGNILQCGALAVKTYKTCKQDAETLLPTLLQDVTATVQVYFAKVLNVVRDFSLVAKNSAENVITCSKGAILA